MAKQVTKFKASDGTLFDTMSQAEIHEQTGAAKDKIWKLVCENLIYERVEVQKTVAEFVIFHALELKRLFNQMGVKS